MLQFSNLNALSRAEAFDRVGAEKPHPIPDDPDVGLNNQYPPNINVSSLDGAIGYTFNGAATGDLGGWGVASAGDVNRDGFADLIIGAIGANPNGNWSGAAYVVFGGDANLAALDTAGGPVDGTIDLSNLNGNRGFKLSGTAGHTYAGSFVNSAGDFNGDGFDDVIIGAPTRNIGGAATAGASYVVFGDSGGFAANLNLAALNGSNGFKITGASSGDHSGYSVASAGDVNGDGLDDLVIGERDDTPTTSPGASFVVFGTASGTSANFNLSSLNGTNGFKLSGVSDRDYNGMSVGSAGDMNGDGFDDILVSSPLADRHNNNSGTTYVVFGHASGWAANFNLSSLNGTNGYKFSGQSTFEQAGRRVASAGDINGDGFDDIIISTRYGGVAYVVLGRANHLAALDAANGASDGAIDLSDLAALNGTSGFKIHVPSTPLPFAVAAAGDVNGDGFDDILIGNNHASPHGGGSGASYVVFGKATPFTATLDVTPLSGTDGFRISGIAGQDESGSSVSSAGDVNGDGLADLIVGAPRADVNGTSSGSSYLIYGKLPDTAVNRTGTVASQNLVGGNQDDTLKGLTGDDHLYGHLGKDTLDGGGGNDILDGGGNAIDKGGPDTASYGTDISGVMVSLAIVGPQFTGGSGEDTLIGIENLAGSKYDDVLTGDADVNVLDGRSGADTLIGGKGLDTLTGGAGNDRFVFTRPSDTANSAPDLIRDFANGDRIDLSRIDANTGLGGDQHFHVGGGGGHAGDMVITFGALSNHTVISLYVDNNASVDATIWLTGDHTDLSQVNFYL